MEHKELLVTVPAGCSEGQKFCMQSPHGGLFNFTVRAGVSAGQQMRVRVPAQRPLTLEVVGDMLSRQQPDAEETAAEAERLGRAYACHSDSAPFLVGDGVPQPAPRSANLDSAFGGMQLFAPEAWRAAPLLLTHSAQLTQPTVRLPQL